MKNLIVLSILAGLIVSASAFIIPAMAADNPLSKDYKPNQPKQQAERRMMKSETLASPVKDSKGLAATQAEKKEPGSMESPATKSAEENTKP